MYIVQHKLFNNINLPCNIELSIYFIWYFGWVSKNNLYVLTKLLKFVYHFPSWSDSSEILGSNIFPLFDQLLFVAPSIWQTDILCELPSLETDSRLLVWGSDPSFNSSFSCRRFWISCLNMNKRYGVKIYYLLNTICEMN